MLKHGILGLLNYESMTGYEIMEVFRDSLNFFWSANTSQIYRELATLRDKGFVTAEVVPQSGKPDKKIFSITGEGQRELKKWLHELDFGNNNSPLCMKIFFSGELSRNENKDRFTAISIKCDEALKRYEEIETIADIFQSHVSNPDASIYWKMTADYGRRYMLMLREWCEASIKILEEKTVENFID